MTSAGACGAARPNLDRLVQQMARRRTRAGRRRTRTARIGVALLAPSRRPARRRRCRRRDRPRASTRSRPAPSATAARPTSSASMRATKPARGAHPVLAAWRPPAADRSRRSTRGSPPCASMIARNFSTPAPLAIAPRTRRSASASSPAMPASTSIRAASRTDSASRSFGPRPFSVSIDFDDFVGVADRAAERRVHRRQQRFGADAVALGDPGEPHRERARVGFGFHERAAADLDVEHERADALGDLLAEDRRADERDALDRAGDVAQRVHAPIGRRDLVGLADQHAARSCEAPRASPRATGACESRESPRACRACRRCGRGRGPTSSARWRRTRRRAARG